MKALVTWSPAPYPNVTAVEREGSRWLVMVCGVLGCRLEILVNAGLTSLLAIRRQLPATEHWRRGSECTSPTDAISPGSATSQCQERRPSASCGQRQSSTDRLAGGWFRVATMAWTGAAICAAAFSVRVS
jgi:hypothetical protein